MNKQCLHFTFFLLIFLSIPSISTAQTVTIPDPNLRTVIEGRLGKASGEPITTSDMAALTQLYAVNSNIIRLTGLEHAINLTYLNLSVNSISDISSLSGLTNLTELYLHVNSISDISPLMELTNLTELSLSYNAISDISSLAGLTNLTQLYLDWNSISDISSLSGLTNLTSLHLRYNSISDISSLSRLTNLTELDLWGNAISDLSALVANTGLGSGDTVNVQANPLSSVSIDMHIPALQSRGVTVKFDNFVANVVSLPDPNLREVIWPRVGKGFGDPITTSDMALFTHLDASESNIIDLTGLEHAINLTELDLNRNSISDISPLAGLTNLRRLYLDRNLISDISPLVGLTNLRSLYLDRNSISDISAVAGLTDLTVLLLWGNSISDISAAAGLTNLRWLHLERNSISDISAVVGLTDLTVLSLWGNSISDISAVAGLTNLTLLHLNGNSISDISAVAGLTNLRRLYLDRNSISDISPLAGLTNLTLLHLDRNSISDISSLTELTNLTELDLNRNSISDISLLAELVNLTELYLESNLISDISSLTGLTNLTELDLNWNLISDLSALVTNTGLGSGATVSLRRNSLSYISINTHIPALQSRGVTVKFQERTPTRLVKISGDNQKEAAFAPLPHPFVVEVRDERGKPFGGVPVVFTVTEGEGKLSITHTATDADGRAEGTLTLGPNLGTNTVSVSATEIEEVVTFNAISDTLPTDYRLSIPAGISLIHVPLRVTAVDGMEQTIESVADLYDALGGAGTVNFLITYDSQAQEWRSYFVPSDRGTSADAPLADDTGIIAGLRAPVSVQLSGDPLGIDGNSAITLNQGLNLVGLPLRDPRISRVSDLFALDGIGGNVPVIILTDRGEFKLVGRVDDPGDVPVTGGQSFILTAQRAAKINMSGGGWYNSSATTAAPSMVLSGIQVTDTTPVLGLRGSIVDEGTGLKAEGIRVTVKNLSTGRAIAAITSPDEAGYRSTVVDIETGRAATVGDILEISAQSPNPFIRVEPLRYTVTAEDVKQSLIQLPELVAYEIPAETELLHNYPNPFNPETWIPYRLAEDAFVALTIYDLNGQIVRTIDVGHQVAAAYESRSKAVYWDGRNGLGEQVASGVYFYHLSAGDYSATRKMVILK